MPRITIKPLHVALLATIACANCAKDEPNDALYVASFKKICHSYAEYCQDLNTQRDPYKPGMTRVQRNAAYANIALDAGNRFAKFAEQEDALQASARYNSIHSESLKLYKLEAQSWQEWAKTVSAGDQELIPQVGKNMDNDARTQYAKLVAEAELLKEDPSIADAVHEMDLPDPNRNQPRGI